MTASIAACAIQRKKTCILLMHMLTCKSYRVICTVHVKTHKYCSHMLTVWMSCFLFNHPPPQIGLHAHQVSLTLCGGHQQKFAANFTIFCSQKVPLLYTSVVEGLLESPWDSYVPVNVVGQGITVFAGHHHKGGAVPRDQNSLGTYEPSGAVCPVYLKRPNVSLNHWW